MDIPKETTSLRLSNDVCDSPRLTDTLTKWQIPISVKPTRRLTHKKLISSKTCSARRASTRASWAITSRMQSAIFQRWQSRLVCGFARTTSTARGSSSRISTPDNSHRIQRSPLGPAVSAASRMSRRLKSAGTAKLLEPRNHSRLLSIAAPQRKTTWLPVLHSAGINPEARYSPPLANSFKSPIQMAWPS